MTTQGEKIYEIEKLFDRIKKLLPESNMDLNIHNIDLDELPTGWKKEKVESKTRNFMIAKRKGKDVYYDITLFEK